MALNNEPATGGVLNGLPSWIRAIAVVGVPSVLSIVLVLFLINLLNSPIQLVAAIKQDIEHIKQDFDTHDTREKSENETNIRLLRQICRNTSKTEIGLDACNR